MFAYELRRQDTTKDDYFTKRILSYMKDSILKDIILSNQYDPSTDQMIPRAYF